MEFTVGLARCPGTCGEWVQGAREGVPFLIDCPINRFSEARVALSMHAAGWDLSDNKIKARQVLELLKENLGLPKLGGKVEFLHQLPEGKGMASSTADISAVAAAALVALGEEPVPERLAHLALQIEPSDSVMFPGITEIEHVQGHNYRFLGSSVPAVFLALDWGGAIDTKMFNARPDLAGHYRRHEGDIGKAYQLACEGIGQGDLEKLAAASTISAKCNLEINHKALFHPFLAWVREKGGLGVVTAHSGTLLAGVFPQGESFNHKAISNLRAEAQQCFTPVYIDSFYSHSGGITAAKDLNSIQLKQVE
ncbi:putative kinase involved in propanediol utilization [Desulfosporosinus orientis DSM 765]|uniref:Putative kinase involved in propanediol utilization n=1 Tax=Desulfosporosinus orientis (strain ATCC 19365 / DSM 765 / NCIMB 8382 / VKM B-1628 / Singapore I) TaxID=768706 RepID=G7WDL0_DESOD|nr:GHMP kinase [Desulfosporosinus orientis]AET68335.1 putative kinase involved in propanediol utilization [Desulfosporosinus orientis DSM 765]